MPAGILAASLLGAAVGTVGLLNLASIRRSEKAASDSGAMGVVTALNIFEAFDAIKVSARGASEAGAAARERNPRDFAATV